MANLKGCFNEKCKANKKRIKFKEDDDFCPKCGQELAYVCNDKRCYEILPNVRQRFCDSCREERAKRQEARKETAHNALVAVPATAAAVVGVVKNGSEVVEVGKKLVKAFIKK